MLPSSFNHQTLIVTVEITVGAYFVRFCCAYCMHFWCGAWSYLVYLPAYYLRPPSIHTFRNVQFSVTSRALWHSFWRGYLWAYVHCCGFRRCLGHENLSFSLYLTFDWRWTSHLSWAWHYDVLLLGQSEWNSLQIRSFLWLQVYIVWTSFSYLQYQDLTT